MSRNIRTQEIAESSTEDGQHGALASQPHDRGHTPQKLDDGKNDRKNSFMSTQNADTNAKASSNEQGNHAKAGLPGKLQASTSSAPSIAGEKSIQAVAHIALELDLKPQHIEILWHRIQDLHADATTDPAGDKTTIQQWGDAE